MVLCRFWLPITCNGDEVVMHQVRPLPFFPRECDVIMFGPGGGTGDGDLSLIVGESDYHAHGQFANVDMMRQGCESVDALRDAVNEHRECGWRVFSSTSAAIRCDVNTST